MSHWNQLPIEILNLVFEYFEITLVPVYHFPPIKVPVPPKALFQCRLTCKEWSSLAERRIYKKVFIKSDSSLLEFDEIMKQVSKGELVDSITFLGGFQYLSVLPKITEAFPVIADSCPYIRSLESIGLDVMLVWTLIKQQSFLRLQKLRIVDPWRRRSDKLTTDEAIQFITYMVKIGDAYVKNMIVENHRDLVDKLNANSVTFRTVSVFYSVISRSLIDSVSVSSKNEKLHIAGKLTRQNACNFDLIEKDTTS